MTPRLIFGSIAKVCRQLGTIVPRSSSVSGLCTWCRELTQVLWRANLSRSSIWTQVPILSSNRPMRRQPATERPLLAKLGSRWKWRIIHSSKRSLCAASVWPRVARWSSSVVRALTSLSSLRLMWVRARLTWNRCAALSRRSLVSARDLIPWSRCTTRSFMLSTLRLCNCTSSTAITMCGPPTP